MIRTVREDAAASLPEGRSLGGYLRFGEKDRPRAQDLDYEGLHDLLKYLGFGGGGLTQARGGTELKGSFGDYHAPGTHYCDFCWKPMAGTEFERLRDGRERCPECSKTVLKRIEEYEELFNRVKRTMVERFGIDFPRPVSVEVVSQRRMTKVTHGSFTPTSGVDARTTGLASLQGRELRMYFENGSPRLNLTATSAHELTHIWQYTHWDLAALEERYGDSFIVVTEGMAVWVEIQYLYLVNEAAFAERTLAASVQRDDEYGEGLRTYLATYPLSTGILVSGDTPFRHPENPLKSD